MQQVNIESWKDGDSGMMVDSNGRRRRFRMSNVNAPGRTDPGFGRAVSRSNNIVHVGDSVMITIVGKDTYGRDLVEMSKNGRNINTMLERGNIG